MERMAALRVSPSPIPSAKIAGSGTSFHHSMDGEEFRQHGQLRRAGRSQRRLPVLRPFGLVGAEVPRVGIAGSVVAAGEVGPVGLLADLEGIDGPGGVLGTILVGALPQARRLGGRELVVLRDLRVNLLLVAPHLDHVEVEPRGLVEPLGGGVAAVDVVGHQGPAVVLRAGDADGDSPGHLVPDLLLGLGIGRVVPSEDPEDVGLVPVALSEEQAVAVGSLGSQVLVSIAAPADEQRQQPQGQSMRRGPLDDVVDVVPVVVLLRLPGIIAGRDQGACRIAVGKGQVAVERWAAASRRPAPRP